MPVGTSCTMTRIPPQTPTLVTSQTLTVPCVQEWLAWRETTGTAEWEWLMTQTLQVSCHIWQIQLAVLLKVFSGLKFNVSSFTYLSAASALGHYDDYIDIYSNSWGPLGTGFIVDGPDSLIQRTFETGVTDVSQTTNNYLCVPGVRRDGGLGLGPGSNNRSVTVRSYECARTFDRNHGPLSMLCAPSLKIMPPERASQEEWRQLQLHSTFHRGVRSVQRNSIKTSHVKIIQPLIVCIEES